MNLEDFKITNTQKLDRLLVKCLELLADKRQKNPEYWGLVAACVLDTDNRAVFGINHITKDGTRKHAERVAIERYEQKYGDIPSGSIIITTLSPCSRPMNERWGESCTDLINSSTVSKVYCGYEDPTQADSSDYLHKKFHTKTTRNSKIRNLCRTIADSFLDSELTESNELNFDSEVDSDAKKITDFLFNTPLAVGNLYENNKKKAPIGQIQSSSQDKWEYLNSLKKITKMIGSGLYGYVFQHPLYHNVAVKIFDSDDYAYLHYLSKFVIPNQNNRYVPKLIVGEDGRIIYKFRLRNRDIIYIVFMKRYDTIQNHWSQLDRYMRQQTGIKDYSYKLLDDPKDLFQSIVDNIQIKNRDPDMYNLALYLIRFDDLDIHEGNIMWDSELRVPVFTDPIASARYA